MTKPLASLSLDLDNKWAYLRTHGVAGWDEYPSYLDVVVPRVLECAAQRDLQITCFVVGRDAGLRRQPRRPGRDRRRRPRDRQPLAQPLSRGCTRFPRDEVEAEIVEAEDADRATPPASGPSASAAPATASPKTRSKSSPTAATDYDATTLPTLHRPAGPLVFPPHGHSRGRRERPTAASYSAPSANGLRPIKPYVWSHRRRPARRNPRHHASRPEAADPHDVSVVPAPNSRRCSHEPTCGRHCEPADCWASGRPCCCIRSISSAAKTNRK